MALPLAVRRRILLPPWVPARHRVHPAKQLNVGGPGGLDESTIEITWRWGFRSDAGPSARLSPFQDGNLPTQTRNRRRNSGSTTERLAPCLRKHPRPASGAGSASARFGHFLSHVGRLDKRKRERRPTLDIRRGPSSTRRGLVVYSGPASQGERIAANRLASARMTGPRVLSLQRVALLRNGISAYARATHHVLAESSGAVFAHFGLGWSFA